jgi:nucleoside-diphosphate-sugar epimerase
MASMMRWLDCGVPLPLGAVDNRRSLLSLTNLVDFIRVCMTHPSAPGQTFLVSDGEDVSTSELLRRMAYALGRRVLLIPVPPAWLMLAGRLTGRAAVLQRLLGTLQVDIGKNAQVLGWQPAVPMSVSLQATADHFREARS